MQLGSIRFWRLACMWSLSLAVYSALASDPAIASEPAVANDPAKANAEEETFFETKIRPLLADSCIECHGPKQASGGLRLDSHAALLKGGETGPLLQAGKPDSSLILRAVRREGELHMPPDAPLPKQAVEDLTRWIESGAKWPASHSTPIPSNKKHWAFEPLSNTPIPLDPQGWASRPIDQFIAAERNKKGLKPVELADKTSLIRRAYFDLVGLPPTPEQIEAFMADESPSAFGTVIDQLLSSQRYGERWGRHWLDLVRYADTAGDNADYPIPQAYLYRDYVIDALNADLPYDQFLREQLAGDILAKADPQTSAAEYARLVTATGFIAQSKRIGTRELEDMHLIIEDTLTTLGPAILGLSIRCARCHDHKFEPLTMQDYYALYGFFASTQYPFAGAEEVRKQTKFAPLLPPAQTQAKIAAHQAQVAELKTQVAALEQKSAEATSSTSNSTSTKPAGDTAVKSAETSGGAEAAKSPASTETPSDSTEIATQLKTLREKLAALEKADPLADVPTAYAVGELEPTDVPIQTNGNPRTSESSTVRRGVPKVLDDSTLQIPAGTSGRLEFANWLTARASPLTARVMANRIWQYHFGKPLVATPSDFGFRGTPPTHPALLDWLAGEFIASRWSIKSMHRTIMLSKTYQLSTQADARNIEIDAGNTLYWRFDRRRLDAESLRDTILMLSGTLDLSRPGPHPFPEPAKWRFTAHHQFNAVSYPSDHRSVYLMVQRLHAHPYLSLFNGADPSLSTPSRDSSTVPLQALYLLNNLQVHQQATAFARQLLTQTEDSSQRIQSAYLQVYGRRPTPVESEKCTKFVSHYAQLLATEGQPADSIEPEAWASLARALMASNEFFYVD
ncbi:MAG: DUF1553 domain-containing protein [Pirellulaceae bacterium]|nr:DUF1553 domain-containing protein [Pirellulaceae bacterium]